MKALILLFISACLITPPAVAKESQSATKQWFVDTNLVYEQGSALSKQYLNKHAPDFSKKLAAILPWVVRIEVQHSFTGTGYTSNHGTGVILRGGKVVTAGHVLTKNVKNLNGKTKILITTIDGHVIPAIVLKQGKKDWMTLQLNSMSAQKSRLNSPIRMATPVVNETAIFLGYPARLGLDEQGKVKSFHKGNEKEQIPVSKLMPMVVVGSVTDIKVMTIKPIAGFPPVGGMSGGPVFNLKGEVIAVQHSVSKTTQDATGEVLSYTIDTVPANDVSP